MFYFEDMGPRLYIFCEKYNPWAASERSPHPTNGTPNLIHLLVIWLQQPKRVIQKNSSLDITAVIIIDYSSQLQLFIIYHSIWFNYSSLQALQIIILAIIPSASASQLSTRLDQGAGSGGQPGDRDWGCPQYSSFLVRLMFLWSWPIIMNSLLWQYNLNCTGCKQGQYVNVIFLMKY